MTTEERLTNLERRFGRGLIIVVFVVLVGSMGLAVTVWVVRTTTGRIEDQNGVIARQNRTLAAQGKALKALVEKVDAQSAVNGQIATAARDAASTGADAARDAASAAKDAASVAEAIRTCATPPNGICYKAQASNQEFVKTQLSTLLTKITNTEFRVTQIDVKAGTAIAKPVQAQGQSCVVRLDAVTDSLPCLVPQG